MTNREASEKFALAKELFTKKRFEDTLDILNELEAAFPNTKNIMFPKALCLAKLGRFDEAHELSADRPFDVDVYRILKRTLADPAGLRIVELG